MEDGWRPRLVEALLAQKHRLSPGQEVPCLAHPHTLATLLDAMETEVSLPSEDVDFSQGLNSDVTQEYLLGEALFTEYLAQFQPSPASLSLPLPPIANNDCFLGVPADMGSFSDAGTTLSEMLQTESILNRRRTESTSSTSSVLTSLLQTGDQRPSMARLTSPTLTQILQSDQVTSSSEPMRKSPSADRSDVMKRTDLALAADVAASIGGGSSLCEILTGSNPIVSHRPPPISLLDVGAMDSANHDADSLCMLLDDASNLMFENGIAASDVGSLLAQFEEATGSMDENPPQQNPSIDPSQNIRTCPLQPVPASNPPVQTSIQSFPPPQPSQIPHAESEVVKLLKAKRPAANAPAAHQRAPSQEVIDKIKSASKPNKLAILLTDALPAKNSSGSRTSRSSTPNGPPAYTSQKLQRLKEAKRSSRGASPPPIPLALQKPPPPSKCSSGSATPRSGSPLRVSLPDIDLEAYTPVASPCSSSRGGTPPPTALPAKALKRISISQYKHRLQQSDSNSRSASPASLEEEQAEGAGQEAELTVRQAADELSRQLEQQQPPELSSDYFDQIRDHDYCQNAPPVAKEDVVVMDANDLGSEVVLQEATDEEKTTGEEVGEMTAFGEEEEEEEEMELVPPVSGEDRLLRLEDLEFGQPESAAEVQEAMTPSVLKSLLMDQNLTEECRAQAAEDRAQSLRNMQTQAERSRVEEEGAPLGTRYSKFDNERQEFKPKQRSIRKRNYRQPSSPEQKYFDKLPSYFKPSSAKHPGMPKRPSATKLLCESAERPPMLDRDPSPDRSDPTFSKMPAYFSCFTNSMKYDSSLKTDSLSEVPVPQSSSDPLGLNNPQVEEGGHSSGTQSPALVIASKDPSRANSVSQRSSSRSPRARSYSRSSSRSKHIRRRRRRSYSSSSSSSSCSSCSATSSSRSRSRSMSRSKSRSSYRRSRRKSGSSARHRSRSRLRSRSRSRRRSYSRARSRDRRRRGYIRRSRSRSRSRSQRSSHPPRISSNTNKAVDKEERRIVYVGRIPSSFSRYDLRQKFETFGEITDVSVHFREHGDNYGFVTFKYTCDAYACVEKGSSLPGCEGFDLCFGGRREFCKTSYADLDGNMEMEEELGGGTLWGRRGCQSKNLASMDFDTLLKQTLSSLNRK